MVCSVCWKILKQLTELGPYILMSLANFSRETFFIAICIELKNQTWRTAGGRIQSVAAVESNELL